MDSLARLKYLVVAGNDDPVSFTDSFGNAVPGRTTQSATAYVLDLVQRWVRGEFVILALPRDTVVMALDPDTGQVVWDTRRSDMPAPNVVIEDFR